MSKIKRFTEGFTLLELLVVIAIIGILSTVVLTSVASQRNKAKDVSFQTTAKGIQNAAGVCCAGGFGVLRTVLSEDICNPASGSSYPSSANIGSVGIIRGCSDAQGFSIKLTPGTSDSGTIDYALCDRDNCEFVSE